MHFSYQLGRNSENYADILVPAQLAAAARALFAQPSLALDLGIFAFFAIFAVFYENAVLTVKPHAGIV